MKSYGWVLKLACTAKRCTRHERFESDGEDKRVVLKKARDHGWLVSGDRQLCPHHAFRAKLNTDKMKAKDIVEVALQMANEGDDAATIAAALFGGRK